MCNGWLFYPFHLEIHVFVVSLPGLRVTKLQNQNQKGICRCVLPGIGECIVWVGQVKVGMLSNGILLNIENIPSKFQLQEAIISLHLVS